MGKITVRRMRQLTERVEQITAEHLDAMEKAGPSADLVTAFAKPIPAIMICELLGVPYEDQGTFQEHIDKFLSGGRSATRTSRPTPRPRPTSRELVAAKRANPTDDVSATCSTAI